MIVVPSKFLKKLLKFFTIFIKKNIIISATKGIDNSGKTMSMIAEEILNRPISVLSGPSHAEEVAKAIPCAVVIASKMILSQKNYSVFYE